MGNDSTEMDTSIKINCRKLKPKGRYFFTRTSFVSMLVSASMWQPSPLTYPSQPPPSPPFNVRFMTKAEVEENVHFIGFLLCRVRHGTPQERNYSTQTAASPTQSEPEPKAMKQSLCVCVCLSAGVNCGTKIASNSSPHASAAKKEQTRVRAEKVHTVRFQRSKR